jgi:CheY-like chemotaxis protein
MASTQAVVDTQLHVPQTAAAHVLAVDDDPIIREAIGDYLGGHEFRETAVPDGGAMRRVLAQDLIDLIVLDLKLVTEDGMALARALRDESALPNIMLTGRGGEADRVMGLELGADDYLTKPFTHVNCSRGSVLCCAAADSRYRGAERRAFVPIVSTAVS